MRRGAIGLGAILALTAAGAGIALSASSQPAPPASTARSSTESTAPGSTGAPQVQLASHSVTGKARKAGTINGARSQQRRIAASNARQEAKNRAVVRYTVAVNKAEAEELVRVTAARNRAEAAARARREAEEARQAEEQEQEQAQAPASPAPNYSGGGGGMGGGWAALRQCESGGNYGAVSSSGQYRGAYQFSQSTWNSVASRVDPGLVGVDPASASPGAQDAMAQALHASSGSSPWPVCGRHL